MNERTNEKVIVAHRDLMTFRSFLRPSSDDSTKSIYHSPALFPRFP